MVTPLSESNGLDVGGTERLIEHIIGAGVHGIFILGTTGEAPSLSYAIRRELIAQTCHQVAGRVPVLVGVTDSSAAETLRLARYAADCGASALVLAPPFYFPIDESELIDYLRTILSQMPLPVFLYNMPTHTKLNFGEETIRAVLPMKNVVGLKDSSSGAASFHAVRQFVPKVRPDFSLLIGSEELMSPCLGLGAHGGVCGGANVFPRLFVELYDATLANDSPRIDQLQAGVLRLAETIYAAAATGYGSICGIKRALCCEGICRDEVALPLKGLRAEQRQRIDEHVRALSAIMPRPTTPKPTLFVRTARGNRGEQQIGDLVR